MFLDTNHALNRGVLQYLGRGGKNQNTPLAVPDSVSCPYLQQGSHPDIVQRVWDDLGAPLPADCRCLVYGTPALVHPASGIVLATCNGTQYNLRLTAPGFAAALALGAATRTRWSSGSEMDALAVLGPDWIFGGWHKEEAQWVAETFHAFTQPARG
jgi:hypothetical protein